MFTPAGKIGFAKELLTEYWTRWEELRKAGTTVDAAANAEEPTQPEESYIAQGRILSDNRPGNSLTPIQKTLDGKGTGQKLTTIQLPSGPNGSGTVIFTSGWSIPKNCNNIPTAAAYINFWVNDHEANTLFASNNGAVTNTVELDSQLKDPPLGPSGKHSLELFRRSCGTNRRRCCTRPAIRPTSKPPSPGPTRRSASMAPMSGPLRRSKTVALEAAQ